MARNSILHQAEALVASDNGHRSVESGMGPHSSPHANPTCQSNRKVKYWGQQQGIEMNGRMGFI